MNYIVMSPYYPPNFQTFSIKMHELGINVLGIGQEPYEQLPENLRASLTEYFRVNNLEDIDEVKRAVAFLFYKHGPIDRIESQNEHWLNNDVLLREQFNVVGLKSDDLLKTKRKSEMKKIFQSIPVPVVEGALVRTEKELDNAVKKLGLPLIAKPDIGVGAGGTFKLASKQDVIAFKQQWQGLDYFLEPFVEGDIITYDGLLDQYGNILFETSLVYTISPMELFKREHDIGYYVVKAPDEKLRKYGKAITQAFGMKERFFHLEFFSLPNDEYVVIEYNNRPPGSYILDIYNMAYQIDLYKEYGKAVLGNQEKVVVFDETVCVAQSRRYDIHYSYSEQELYQKYGQYIIAKLETPRAFADLQGDVVYIVKAESQTLANEVMQAIYLRA
ncbi:hypothetical protein K7G92_001330 [Pasteurella canis]|uniref:ATP-grasp domain-containing protein n=1 Tax=Pasteurella canis TaxID=753 RepID=UPI001E64833C|nr:hypothetical protein [Pasteurella canis]UEA16111.1 hypothetical protein K7G92_001330 [Pasteurella canis]